MSTTSSLSVKILALIAVCAISFSPVAVLAVDGNAGGGTGAVGGNAGGGTGANDPTGPQSTIDTEQEVIDVIQRITNWMFTIFIAVAAMMIIYAAFIYLTSGGGEEVSKAHKMLLYAAIAIVVATMSRAIVRLVENFVK